jgi:hypothetical protein
MPAAPAPPGALASAVAGPFRLPSSTRPPRPGLPALARAAIGRQGQVLPRAAAITNQIPAPRAFP